MSYGLFRLQPTLTMSPWLPTENLKKGLSAVNFDITVIAVPQASGLMQASWFALRIPVRQSVPTQLLLTRAATASSPRYPVRSPIQCRDDCASFSMTASRI